MDGYIPTEYCLAVYFGIENEEIHQAKLWMHENWGNKYISPPHVTLIISPLPENKIDEATALVGNYLQTKNKIYTKYSTLKTESSDFLYLDVIGDELINIHNELLEVLKPIRMNYVRQKDFDKVMNNELPEWELESAKKYGFARSAENFKAHITIGNINTDKPYELEAIKKHVHKLLGDVEQGELIMDKLSVGVAIVKEGEGDQNIYTKEYTLIG